MNFLEIAKIIRNHNLKQVANGSAKPFSKLQFLQITDKTDPKGDILQAIVKHYPSGNDSFGLMGQVADNAHFDFYGELDYNISLYHASREVIITTLEHLDLYRLLKVAKNCHYLYIITPNSSKTYPVLLQQIADFPKFAISQGNNHFDFDCYEFLTISEQLGVKICYFDLSFFKQFNYLTLNHLATKIYQSKVKRLADNSFICTGRAYLIQRYQNDIFALSQQVASLNSLDDELFTLIFANNKTLQEFNETITKRYSDIGTKYWQAWIDNLINEPCLVRYQQETKEFLLWQYLNKISQMAFSDGNLDRVRAGLAKFVQKTLYDLVSDFYCKQENTPLDLLSDALGVYDEKMMVDYQKAIANPSPETIRLNNHAFCVSIKDGKATVQITLEFHKEVRGFLNGN